MHVEYTHQVVRGELALEVESFQSRQRCPGVIDGKKQSECGGAVEELVEFGGENLMEIGQVRVTGDYGCWEAVQN